ncbi:FecR family protein [Mucilaginibacter sp. P25]|uniref:Ferric-dicitrate binding protein FerR, regulates iron transport through sigma-19 n=1 Tax=Mucilaginibacter gossypii TaxID=551996 RepID=A0A1G7ZGA5_9SPHI|nr:FecR domain-containing protein [Mucilaginibacter gossypii]SDH07714.1 ferric-dicitrate binding protein FerR, regulates iron transport through sigma-19 [Mucilaginibacter gossypii]
MQIAKYSNYTLPDFLEDDDFLRFVINPSHNDTVFWQQVAAEYPQQKEIIAEASKIIKAYRKQDVFTNEANQSKVWLRIESTLQIDQAKPKIFTLSRFLRIAAMLLLVSSIGISLWLVKGRQNEIDTTFGELRTVTLPDGSTVVLNGNSKLTYSGNWDEKSREVWISGEGLFNVKHINKDPRNIKPTERFIVHCSDMDIEVLGTTFNVRSRHNKTNVGLVQGKIRLDYVDAASGKLSLIMKPGDYVQHAYRKTLTRMILPVPEKITKWTKHQLLFNDASLAQISEIMTDDYGYHVDFLNPDLANLKIEGEINVPSVEELIETIATTLPVKITRTDKNITITKLNP